MMKLLFVCPNCKKSLKILEECYHCPHCNEDYPLIENIICFDKTAKENMQKKKFNREVWDLLELAKKTSWQNALDLKVRKQQPLRYERLIYKAAADSLFLLPLNKEAVVLDAGSGWGTLTFQLAQHYKSVVALDNSPYASEFIKIRAHQDGISNIFPIVGNVLKLPFPENYFDLVVINGVLEWVGLTDTLKNPLQVQEDFLKEVSRVLKPDGYLYLGIENRWSATYFLGKKEDHTNLRFISLIPRSIAKIYHKLIKKSDYRVYTHSLKDYHKMLKKAGFPHIHTYAPIPNYHKYSHMISLENINAAKYYVQSLFRHKKISAILVAKIVRFFHLYRFMKYFVPCYSFVAGKQLHNKSIDFFLKIHCRNLFPEQRKILKQFFYVLSSGTNHVVLLIFTDDGKTPLCLAKIRRVPDVKKSNKEYTVLENLKKIKAKSHLMQKSIPEVLYCGKIGNEEVLLEKIVDGIFLENIIRRKTNPLWWIGLNKKLYPVINWLIEFQKLTKKGDVFLDGEILSNYFSTIYDAAEKYKNSIRNKSLVFSRLNDLKKHIDGKSIPLVTQHRDLGPHHILIADGNIVVLDWEISQESGDPLCDIFYFLAQYFFFIFYNPSTEPIINPATLAKHRKATFFRGKGYIHDTLSEIMCIYCHSMKIDFNVAKMLFLREEIHRFKNLDILNLFFEEEDKFVIND